MLDTRSKWEDELERWLKPFLDRLGHKARIVDLIVQPRPQRCQCCRRQILKTKRHE
jgi:hypothetical protein